MRLAYGPGIREAIDERRGVVALESTVIAHGLPRPRNLETARLLEAEVRDAGAVPATICLADGMLVVGANDALLARLANAEGVAKISTRDLAPFLARVPGDGLGATTVATTAEIASRAGDDPHGAWTVHVVGRVERVQGPRPACDLDHVREVRARCSELVTDAALHRALDAQGMHFGPRFRGLERLWRRDGEALGEVAVPRALAPDLDGHPFHPALLDACFQTIGAALPEDAGRSSDAEFAMKTAPYRKGASGTPRRRAAWRRTGVMKTTAVSRLSTAVTAASTRSNAASRRTPRPAPGRRALRPGRRRLPVRRPRRRAAVRRRVRRPARPGKGPRARVS